MTDFELPRLLVESAARDNDDRRREWIARLPGVVADCAARWSLELQPPFQPGGETAWVAPARDPDGRDVVLKVVWPHTEAEHEAEGLRAWAGQGSVLLHDVHTVDVTSALLLERCLPGTELARTAPAARRDEVIADLLTRMWVTPPEGHPFRPLQQMCDQWADEYLDDPSPLLDPGMARAGLELFRALPKSAERQVLLLTDLHPNNVLAAGREPWLVIDPKPYVGDPTYDPLQHMLNERLHDDPYAFARRMADLCGVDADRLLLWLFARLVVETSWREDLVEVAERLAP